MIMANFSSHLHLFSTLLIIISSTQAQQFKPTSLVLAIHKDPTTQLHIANITQRTPKLSLPFVIDLNGHSLWENCDPRYRSSTYQAPRCGSPQCSLAGARACLTCPSPRPRQGCHNNTCGVTSINPVSHTSGLSELAEDALSVLPITNSGSNAGPPLTVPRFLFACAPASLLRQSKTNVLPKGVQGFAGLGPSPIAFPTQLSSRLGLHRKFAICLDYDGIVLFGDGPYIVLPGIDISKSLSYTPLAITREGEYSIGITSIQINNKNVPLSTSTSTPIATKISTVIPYTILRSDIFKAMTQFYAKELKSVPRVANVAPFGMCFNATYIGYSRMGPAVPGIDLVLHRKDVVWRLFGANVVTRGGNDAVCLAFVDGGARPGTPITVGAMQLENYLLQFDLGGSRLGFTRDTLLFQRTRCSNFNFTS
ncbi:hypothetical protein Syun_029089 [Stephania yunnanensis]|uniref:Peptidase A1 domain-containing protein n=1 Tax=Stephania yunnanensis TaxID=152371 RepID=A0AAP0E4R0_9MAGN